MLLAYKNLMRSFCAREKTRGLYGTARASRAATWKMRKIVVETNLYMQAQCFQCANAIPA